VFGKSEPLRIQFSEKAEMLLFQRVFAVHFTPLMSDQVVASEGRTFPVPIFRRLVLPQVGRHVASLHSVGGATPSESASSVCEGCETVPWGREFPIPVFGQFAARTSDGRRDVGVEAGLLNTGPPAIHVLEASEESSDDDATHFGGPDDGPGMEWASSDESEEDEDSDVVHGAPEEEDREEESAADRSSEGLVDDGTAVRGRHYNYYCRLKRDVEEIFGAFLPEMPRGMLAAIERAHPGIPGRTVRHWYGHWKGDREWRPYRCGRRGSRRVFSDAQEEALLQLLQDEFWVNGRPLTTRRFRSLVVAYWEQYPGEPTVEKFTASSNFRVEFCRRRGLSLRTASIGRAPQLRHVDMVEEFLEKVEAARVRFGADRVVNMDETSWKDVQLYGRTIAPKRVAVRLLVRGECKAAITAICTVSMSGDKYPSLYVLRGKRESLLRSLEPWVGPERVTLSKNGWMDESVMLRYLSWVHIALGCRPFSLVLDSFRGHTTMNVLRKAKFLGVELIPVPKGMTGQYQPLDRSCFGPLKKMSQKGWDIRAAENPELKWDHREGARLLEEVWPRLTRATVLRGWQFQGGISEYPVERRVDQEAEEGSSQGQDHDDSDSDFESRSSEMSGSAPSEEADAPHRRLAWTRGRGVVQDPVIEVRACLHDQPTEDPRWAEIELGDAWGASIREDRRIRASQRRQQLRVEAQLNKSFLFPRWLHEKPRAMREDEFLFVPPPPPRDQWENWKDARWGGRSGADDE
jgi:hypothetical protein